jgi:hypothetical protein
MNDSTTNKMLATDKELYNVFYAEKCEDDGRRAVFNLGLQRGAQECFPTEVNNALRDAISALRYIEQQYGRLYGIGWDRVFDAAEPFLSGLPISTATHPQDKEGRDMSNQESGIIVTGAGTVPSLHHHGAGHGPADGGGMVPARIVYSPKAWRLGRRNGELILQAGSLWVQGRESGIEWNDLPTVKLDELEHNYTRIIDQ